MACMLLHVPVSIERTPNYAISIQDAPVYTDSQ